MRLWAFSDLHLEYADLRSPLTIPEADICICAGDLMRAPANGVHWLAKNIAPAMPCVYVAGNHEFYKGGIKECFEDGRAAAAQFPDVHFLENDSAVIDGVRFIGATHWTDYRIEGSPEIAMHHARQRMNDYRKIAKQRNPWERFVPQTAYRMHQESRLYIDSALKADREPLAVVVSHHLPSLQSLNPRFKGDLLNAAYASDLEQVIKDGRPTLWVHGHIHDSADYRIGDTRVVCNPRGYADENAAFNPALVIEVRA